ncbi:hypothetical protein GGX14DRAFT_557434 [Mycena pura]|uniref:F-box domain-containing protein n=1 Tax=Mycena pura TaxID=153505 RepID=A0AAD7E2Z5_9AGAR|nr:hypothetical protein GGX14DRAFT_557434 [Mycena pura]
MATQQSYVPALTLPNELMTHIFLYCLPPHGRVRPNPKTGPLLVAQICRHWRAVALSFPRLWASIALDLTVESVINQKIALVGLWLSRASRSPLSITINGPLDGSRLPAGIFSLIKSSSVQWGRLELMIPAPDFLELCEVAGPFPHLQVVAIENADHSEGNHIEFRAPFLDAPKLQVLRIDCFECTPGKRSQSTSAVKFPIRRSTEIFQMFERFPNLRHLIVTRASNYRIDGLTPELSDPCPPLRSLVLYDCGVMPLKHLTLPTLEDLKIVDTKDGYSRVIADFVARSSCMLKVLSLEFPDKDDPLELERALRASPSIITLCFSFNSPPRIVWFMLHPLDVLPCLTNIHIRTEGMDDVAKWDIFLGLVRARPALLVADFLAVGGGVPLPTARQIAGFGAVAERGMHITLKREDDDQKSWQWPDGPEEDIDENFGFGDPVTYGSLPYVWNRYPPTV